MGSDNAELCDMLLETREKLSMLEEIPSQLAQALRVSEQFKATKILDLAFHRLGVLSNFSRPNPRYDDVREATMGTCEWILKEPERLLKVEDKLTMTFVQWLQEGDGVFHVAGKPGSGKSTLMKYLCEHEEVLTHLYKWAGPSQLIFTRYFFWKPDDLQNGFRGLKRCLLWEVIDQVPELCQTLFPGLQYQPMEPLGSRMPEFSDKEVSRALETFWDYVQVSDGIRVFVLIDGLDEFHENAEDHNDLVRTIQSWVSKGSGKAKFCVSSREYDAFSVFPESQRIRLHKLTARDIRTVILERLRSHSRFPQFKDLPVPNRVRGTPSNNIDTNMSPSEEIDSNEIQARLLVKDIVKKAEGVFLWVHLVLRDLRKCLDGGLSISRLRSRVNVLPEDLKTFLGHLFDTIHPQFRRQTYTLFTLIILYDRAAVEPAGEKRKLGLDCPGLCLGGAYYLYNISDVAGTKVGVESLSADSIENQEINFLKREQIGDLTNGLLEIGETYDGENFWGNLFTDLKFTHRSVIEVLQKSLEAKLDENNITPQVLAQVACGTLTYEFLCGIKNFPRRSLVCSYICNKVGGFFLLLTLMGLSQDPVILEQLSIVDDISLRFYFGRRRPTVEDAFYHRELDCGLEMPKHMAGAYYTVLIQTVLLDHASYALWCLENYKMERYGWIAPRTLFMLDETESPDGALVIRSLFEKGICRFDDRKVNIRYEWDKCVNGESSETGLCLCALTPAMLSRIHIGQLLLAFISDPPIYNSAFPFLKPWELMEIWMEYGADALYKIAPTYVSMGSIPALEIHRWKNGRWILAYRKTEIRHEVWELVQSKRQRFLTLGDIAESEKPKNLERVLELIDRNTERQYAPEEAKNRAAFEELPSSEIIGYEYFDSKERGRSDVLSKNGRWRVRDTSYMIVAQAFKMSSKSA